MQIITPSPITAPPPEQDIHITRGDTFSLVVGFTGEPEVVANPAAFRQRLVIRRRQSDALPALVSVDGSLSTESDERFNEVDVDVVATFTLTPEQTASLPSTGAVYFIEWTDAGGGNNRRIFQGRVTVGD